MSNSQSDGLGKLLTETIWKPYGSVDDRCPKLTDAETVGERWRHSIGTRLFHWSQVILMLVLVLTGFAIWSGVYGPLDMGIWGGYYVAFGLHMWAGILIVAVSLVLFPYYHIVADHHDILPDRADLTLSVNVVLALLGRREYPPNYHKARRTWDRRAKEWMTGHPAQKMYFWAISALIVLVALTGFASYSIMAVDPPGWIVSLGFLANSMSLEALKQVHFVLAAVITAMVLMHAYFPALPGNWDMLKSMVTGDMEIYYVNEPEDSETADD
ncbi:MAG: cytochrome b/b6 domain-containing protein [Halodesulfurarchaeum sp.]